MKTSLFIFIVVAALCDLASASRPVTRFAIVIGVNAPETTGLPHLRYADDDAVAMHELFTEAGVTSALYATLDEDTRRLHPSVKPAGPARWQNVQGAFAALERPLRDAIMAGSEPELYVFYSGHGDVADGEGYVVLDDGRLTRSRLRELLDRTKAAHRHVLVDACRSYYLAFAKGKVGKRSKLDRSLVGDDGARLSGSGSGSGSGIGFVLSTSSDRDSHEWDRYQGGIFSHEIRSALRGSADANGDGVVTYAELGAFLAAANQSIPNARFRPDFLLRPPASLQTPLLAWPTNATALTVDRPIDHFYVEDALGVRLLDAHPASDQRLVLRLPADAPAFVRTADQEIVVEHPTGRLSESEPGPVTVARKGAMHLAFETLFSTPFGPHKVNEYERVWTAAHEAASAVERPPTTRAKVRHAAGWSFIGFAVLGASLEAIALERYETGLDESQHEQHTRNTTIHRLNTAGFIACGAAGIAGAVWLSLGVSLWKDADTELVVDPAPGGGSGFGMTWQGRF